jgi:small subunit ribosomal protein S5
VPAPKLPRGQASLLRPSGGASALPLWGEASQAAETDALHAEQAKALLEAGAAGAKAPAAAASASSAAAASLGLSDDGESDWGGDPLDLRFNRDPRLQYAEYRARHGLPAWGGRADGGGSDVERLLLNAGVEEEDGTRISPIFGLGPGATVESIPSQIVEELARPYDFFSHGEEELFPPAATVREAAMSPEERVLDQQRKALRALIEKPLPMVNRPLWPTYAMVTGVDQVHQVVSGGMIQSTRCMIVVGNGMGGAGFGMGKHKEPFQATKMALANAHRDMIHVSTHKGQLYHDLIGKKNSVYVIIRTLPSGTTGCKGAPLLQDVFEMMGVTHASAKVVGSKRRNPYTVVQALFDAFNHHVPPEDEAFKRGLRMTWMGANRGNGRFVFPYQPTGPRYPPANARHV